MAPNELASEFCNQTLALVIDNLKKSRHERQLISHISTELTSIFKSVEYSEHGEFIFSKFGDGILINQWIQECQQFTPYSRTGEQWAQSLVSSWETEILTQNRSSILSYVTRIGSSIRNVINQPEDFKSIQFLNNIADINDALFKQINDILRFHFAHIEAKIDTLITHIIPEEPPVNSGQLGWAILDGKWVYYKGNHELAKNEWKRSNNEWYYLDENGFLLQNTTISISEVSYDLDDTGKLTHIDGQPYLVTNW